MNSETSEIAAEIAVVATLVCRLDELGLAYGGAALAVSLPGWAFDAVGRTAFIVSGDADRVSWLSRAIEKGGVPSAFLFVKGEGRQAAVCCDPLPWTVDEQDYLDTIAHHFADVLICGGKAAPGKVN
jgi:hypothetical protein